METLLKLTERQQHFLEYAKCAHYGQFRKYTGESYINHPIAVAALVQTVVDEPGLLIEIALGHDLFEDTHVKAAGLRAVLPEMGYMKDEIDHIVFGIQSLTDEYTKENWPTWNRTTRKEHEAHRLSRIPAAFQTVKYADLIHNTESIVEHDKNFAILYLKEKEAILSRMRNGDIDLLFMAYESLKKAKECCSLS